VLEVIFLKKIVLIAYLVVVLFVLPILSFNHVIHIADQLKVDTTSNNKPPQGTKERLYQDIFVSLLHPYTQNAIREYYKAYLAETPVEDPYFVTVLSAEMVVSEPHQITSTFLIKLEAAPYLGPHNSIGIDHITFRVQSDEVILEKYEHIKSFPIPPNYQQFIKKWPPQ
jgi:hypothetical protein